MITVLTVLDITTSIRTVRSVTESLSSLNYTMQTHSVNMRYLVIGMEYIVLSVERGFVIRRGNMTEVNSPTVTCGACGKKCKGLVSVIINERLQYVCDECALELTKES